MFPTQKAFLSLHCQPWNKDKKKFLTNNKSNILKRVPTDKQNSNKIKAKNKRRSFTIKSSLIKDDNKLKKSVDTSKKTRKSKRNKKRVMNPTQTKTEVNRQKWVRTTRFIRAIRGKSIKRKNSTNTKAMDHQRTTNICIIILLYTLTLIPLHILLLHIIMTLRVKPSCH